MAKIEIVVNNHNLKQYLFNKPNNKSNFCYNSNRTYFTLMNMSPYVENPKRERFHQISQSSKFLNYRITLYDTEHNKIVKGNHPEW